MNDSSPPDATPARPAPRRRRFRKAVGPRLKPVLTAVFALFALLALNAVYLLAVRGVEAWTGQTYQNWFYLTMFLGHLVLGLLLIVPVVLFGLLMPLVGGTLAALCAVIIGLPAGTAALLIILSASASYIAVPAAMRVALPEANPSIYLTLSLGVTFPFNLTLGIPLYIAVASALVG